MEFLTSKEFELDAPDAGVDIGDVVEIGDLLVPGSVIQYDVIKAYHPESLYNEMMKSQNVTGEDNAFSTYLVTRGYLAPSKFH